MTKIMTRRSTLKWRAFLLCLGLVAQSSFSSPPGGEPPVPPQDLAAEAAQVYMEVGVGFAAQYLADYRGSKRYALQGLPAPYFVYLGRFLKADAGGVRGELFRSERMELNISADGTLGGDTEGNELRRGMSEIANTAELGPSLNINLSGAGFSEGWSVLLPLRGVVAVDFDVLEPVGFLFNPLLVWRSPDLFSGWRTTATLGLMYGNRSYHSYYYSVSADEALSWRPAYRAESGYSGGFARLSAYQSVGDWRFGVSVRYDNLAGATFEDSPLVETKHYGAISFGLTYRFWSNED